jgi:hypothetical protein
MWFCWSELLDSSHWLALHQSRSSLNGTHPINRPLKKSRKSLVRHKYFSVIQTSIIVISFLFILIHQIISWGYLSCRIKSKTTIALYSRKLNTAQKRYTTTERYRELLSAIEICKEYKNILLRYHLPMKVFQTIRIIPSMAWKQPLQTAFCLHAGFYSLKNIVYHLSISHERIRKMLWRLRMLYPVLTLIT